MGISFQFKVVNAEDLSASLLRFEHDIGDFTRIWPKVTEELEKEEAELFVSRGASGQHGPWAPLTERYLERKYKKYGEQPIEVAAGRLRRAMTDSTSGDAIREYMPRQMRFGTSLPYAIFQQTGWVPSHLGRYGLMGQLVDRMVGKKKPAAKFRRGRVPARRVIDPTEAWGIDVRRVVMKEIDNLARRAGFGRGKAMGLGLGPGAARQYGYGTLTGLFMGEGTS